MGSNSKKTVALRVFIAVVVLAVIGVGVRIYYTGSIMGCDKAEPQSVVSPDKKWTAVQVLQICGEAIGTNYSQVELRDGNGDSATVFDAEVPYVEIVWQDAKHLEVKYSRSADVLKKKEAYDGVTITYVTDPPS